MSLSIKNQSNDLLHKLMDWFLYDKDLHHERVNVIHIYGQQDVISKWMKKTSFSKTYYQERTADMFRRTASKILSIIKTRLSRTSQSRISLSIVSHWFSLLSRLECVSNSQIKCVMETHNINRSSI